MLILHRLWNLVNRLQIKAKEKARVGPGQYMEQGNSTNVRPKMSECIREANVIDNRSRWPRSGRFGRGIVRLPAALLLFWHISFWRPFWRRGQGGLYKKLKINPETIIASFWVYLILLYLCRCDFECTWSLFTSVAVNINLPIKQVRIFYLFFFFCFRYVRSSMWMFYIGKYPDEYPIFRMTFLTRPCIIRPNICS